MTNTKKRDAEALSWIMRSKSKGITVKELDTRASWDPNRSLTSAVLSTMHKNGRIVRLAESRDGCGVYVHPDFTKGRPTKPQGFKKTEDCVRPECVMMEQMYLDAAAELTRIGKILSDRGITV